MKRARSFLAMFVPLAYLLTLGLGHTNILCISSNGHIALEYSWIGCIDGESPSSPSEGDQIGAGKAISGDPCTDVGLIKANLSGDTETAKIKASIILAVLPLVFFIVYLGLSASGTLPRPPNRTAPLNGTLAQLRTVILLN